MPICTWYLPGTNFSALDSAQKKKKRAHFLFKNAIDEAAKITNFIHLDPEVHVLLIFCVSEQGGIIPRLPQCEGVPGVKHLCTCFRCEPNEMFVQGNTIFAWLNNR